MVPMKPQRLRRLLLGGSVLFVGGWLGLLALVAPALLGAVAAATLLPVMLVALPYLVVRIATRIVDDPDRLTPPSVRGTDGSGSDGSAAGSPPGTNGPTEAD